MNTLTSFISASGIQYFEKGVLYFSLLNDKTNNLLTLLNVGSIKLFKLLVLVCLSLSDLYLFYLVVLLNSVFNCSNNLLSSSVDKVTIGTNSFVFKCCICWSFNFFYYRICIRITSLCYYSSQKTTLKSCQNKIYFTINGISKVLQKLPKYFDGTAIFFFNFYYNCVIVSIIIVVIQCFSNNTAFVFK